MKQIISNLIKNVIYKFIKLAKPIDRNSIAFLSRPDFSDNARALSDYLMSHNENEDYKIYWIVKNPQKYYDHIVKDKITFLSLKNRIGLMPLKTCTALLTSKYIFATHNFPIPKEENCKEQFYYLLWHGCGFKDKVGNHYTQFDKAFVPGKLFINPKSRYWKVDSSKIIALGYPRYDWLLHPSKNATDYYKSVKGKYSKVIIWMPTFRNSNTGRLYAESNITQFPLMSSDKDWAFIDDICRENNVLLIVKLHISQKSYSIDFSKLSNIRCLSNADFEREKIQMYEFVSLTDALITDYSSVSFDYLVVNKPIAYALDDFEQYKNARGFVFPNPLDYMPGHHLYDTKQLSMFISDVNNGIDKYKEAREHIKSIAINTSTNYCETILRKIKIIH